jgi:hypothetical protein
VARPFRFLGKKRGQRRTGSNTLGRAGLGLFSAICFAIGVISLAFIVLKFSIPEWRANHEFVETNCRVLATRAAMSNDGSTRPEIEVNYTVDEENLTTWSHYDISGIYQSDAGGAQAILERFEPGQEYPGWYDPRHPETVVLARGYTWFAWLMLLLPAAFISIGGGGLAYTMLTWGKSTERLAAAGGRAPGLELLLPAYGTEEFPFVPDPHDLNDSPGTRLKYRLPTGTGRWRMVAIVVVCIFWNGVVALFARMAFLAYERGEPDWFLTVFLVPLAIAGLALIALLVREIATATAVGPTLVEISAHPLTPGREYDMVISQSGRLSIGSLQVKLVCEEVARYRQGTNTRTATRRVYEQSLASRDAFDIRPGVPFEVRGRLKVPAEAMHSFTADHNQVDWKIVVNAAITRWPDFERTFPLIVRPAAAPGDGA